MKRLIAALLLLTALCMLPAADYPVFALVLSGGGAKGIAHIPVLEELDRRGIVPDMVIGTSMGAVIGGLYASGHSGEDLEALVRETDLMDYFLRLYAIRSADIISNPFIGYDTNLLTVEFGASGFGATSGLVDDQYISGLLRSLMAKTLDTEDFNELPIPFRAVGTDITNKQRIVFGKGSLFTAIRASMAIPVVFSPVRLEDGSFVMDGGLEDNMPADIARTLGADIVLAVDVGDSLDSYGSENNDMSTLSGAVSGFTEYLTEPNSAWNYKYADWVIVPDTTAYSSLSFADTAAILEKGQEAVDASMDIFDELEARLAKRIPDMEWISYDSLPARTIESIVTDELIPASVMPELEEFIGLPFDTETAEAFELLLDDIRRHEGLLSISYGFSDGVITIDSEEYPSLPGSLHLGLSGGIGLRYSKGSSGRLYFAYTPDFALSGRFSVAPDLDLMYGLIVDEGLMLDAGLSYPLGSSMAFFYLDLGIRYGQLSWFSVPGTQDYRFSNDAGVMLKIGTGVLPLKDLRLDAVIGLDYSFLESRSLDIRNYLYPYIGLGLVYDGYDGGNASDTGAEASIMLEAGADFPESSLSYSFIADAFLCYGPPGIARFIAEGKAATIRRPAGLMRAYVPTVTGQRTSDYIYLMTGARFILPYSFFIDAGVFFDAAGTDHEGRMPLAGRSLVPFSELEHFHGGGYLAAGIATQFGQIKAALHVSSAPGFSLMVGIL